RAAHTLKGSSRMASIAGVDEVAARLETLLEDVASGSAAADGVLFAKLHNAIDGLYRMVGDIRQGVAPDARAVLAELEAAAPFVPDVAETAAPPVEPPVETTAAAELAAGEEAAEEIRAF